MKETFQQLRTLQKLDTELKTLRDRLTEVPRAIETLKQSARKVETDLAATRDSIVEHKKQYKLAELDLKSAEEKISTYSVQLYSAKTNEQYKAFLKEIETQKKLKSGIEDRMILLMEEAEALERKRQSTEKENTQLETDTTRKVGTLEAEQRELEGAVAEREQHRESLVQSLPSQPLRLYERISKSKVGQAIVSTRKDRCNGCMNPVPPQRLLEIERQDHIYTCEACGRILMPDKD